MSSRNHDRNTVLDLSAAEASDAPDATRAAVESPSFDEAVKTVFGLNDRDLATLTAIQSKPGITTRDIADVIDRDRSNVTRSVTVLRETGLVTRRRRIMEDGGYFYEHYAESTEGVERVLTDAIERWARDAVESVATFDWTVDDS